jgi:integrase
MRSEVDRGRFDPGQYVKRVLKPFLFENYVDAWITRREQDCRQQEISKAYLKEIKAYSRLYFIPFFQGTSIKDIRKSHLEDFLRQLPQRLSSKTRYNIMGVLHKILKDAREREEIAKMPLFPKVKKREARTRFIGREEQASILQYINGVYKTFFTFLMGTGCRTGEGRALRWENVDFKNNTVTIAASFDLDTYKPYTKTGSVRYLPISQEVKRALMSLPRSIDGWVFINSKGRYLSNRRIRAVWKEATQKAGVEITIYEATRHSFASQAICEGAPERMIGEFLGHKHAATTRRYAKVRAERLRTVLEALGDRP